MDNEFKYHVDRKVWQPLWMYLMADYGQDGDFENNTFAVYMYDWMDLDSRPDYNFWHKPSGYKLAWYKYPLRGTTANMDITPGQFVDILNDCVNSILACRKPKFSYQVDKWWEEGNEQ